MYEKLVSQESFFERINGLCMSVAWTSPQHIGCGMVKVPQTIALDAVRPPFRNIIIDIMKQAGSILIIDAQTGKSSSKWDNFSGEDIHSLASSTRGRVIASGSARVGIFDG